MLINVKMPTIVGILTFMNRINFVFSLVEYEKKIYYLGVRAQCSFVRLGIEGLLVPGSPLTESLMFLSKTFYRR